MISSSIGAGPLGTALSGSRALSGTANAVSPVELGRRWRRWALSSRDMAPRRGPEGARVVGGPPFEPAGAQLAREPRQPNLVRAACSPPCHPMSQRRAPSTRVVNPAKPAAGVRRHGRPRRQACPTATTGLAECDAGANASDGRLRLRGQVARRCRGTFIVCSRREDPGRPADSEPDARR